MYAYGHATLDEETIKLTGFSSGDRHFAFIRGFLWTKRSSKFFHTTNVYIFQTND